MSKRGSSLSMCPPISQVCFCSLPPPFSSHSPNKQKNRSERGIAATTWQKRNIPRPSSKTTPTESPHASSTRRWRCKGFTETSNCPRSGKRRRRSSTSTPRSFRRTSKTTSRSRRKRRRPPTGPRIECHPTCSKRKLHGSATTSFPSATSAYSTCPRRNWC